MHLRVRARIHGKLSMVIRNSNCTSLTYDML